jgi:putative oxidoreductase
MLRKLISTKADYGTLIARVTVGAVLVPHGFQHALGLLGGYGFSGTLKWMTGTLGFPAPLAAIAIVTELIAPFALIFGLGGRVAALGIVGLMAGAASSHAQFGFFMNWFGALQSGSEGFEYHLLAIGLATAVVFNGSGAFSIDRLLTRNSESADVDAISKTGLTPATRRAA